jgi:hypothetical protein
MKIQNRLVVATVIDQMKMSLMNFNFFSNIGKNNLLCCAYAILDKKTIVKCH